VLVAKKGPRLKPAYILIDFENVQPEQIGALDAAAFKIKVFVGARQSRVAIGLASALQPLGTAAEYVQIEGSGRNALDLHIAYYIGRLACVEPEAHFHIVSRDTDYDPLISHLKKRKIHCQRWSAITDIPHARAHAPAKPAAAVDRADEIVANLAKRKRALPSTLKSLSSSIKAHFANRITEAEIGDIVDKLKARGLLSVKDGKVSYQAEK
jgi:hypothetical protein